MIHVCYMCMYYVSVECVCLSALNLNHKLRVKGMTMFDGWHASNYSVGSEWFLVLVEFLLQVQLPLWLEALSSFATQDESV